MAMARRTRNDIVRVVLCGDVMIGRGIDQALQDPCDPELHEPYVSSALDYVRLAEQLNGAIPRPVSNAYIWGAFLDELRRVKPDASIINLETSITRSGDFADKGINYRVSPENAGCLADVPIDCCVLANNHVLDFGPDGLRDTLSALDRLKIKRSGAGKNAVEAAAPAILEIGDRARLLIWSFAFATSGVPPLWAATQQRAGVNFLRDMSDDTILKIARQIASMRLPRDIVIVSLHWGPNWGYAIPHEYTRFARALLDQANASIIFGHSSHHPKAIELYRERLVLYGCGDFLNDYEGIQGYEQYRGDIVAMYVVDVDASTKNVTAVEAVLFRIRRLQLAAASEYEREWLCKTLDRESRVFATAIEKAESGRLIVRGSPHERV
jgi:poly-gamma-glutamate capsule biosynthesis protein CapA/YwtB (metallophosphatase superfamily)